MLNSYIQKLNVKYYIEKNIELDFLIISESNDLYFLNKKKEHMIRSKLDSFYLKAIFYQKPVVGICYGAQFIAHYYDSEFKIYKDHIATKHKIIYKNKKPKEFSVNSYHNYGI